MLVASWVLPLSTFLGSRGSLFLCLHNFIYWFAESSLLRGLFSAAAIRGYSLGTVLGLLNVVASLVVAHGLGCSMACGIFPDQGSNPCTPYWQADSLSLSHQGSPTALLSVQKSPCFFHSLPPPFSCWARYLPEEVTGESGCCATVQMKGAPAARQALSRGAESSGSAPSPF